MHVQIGHVLSKAGRSELFAGTAFLLGSTSTAEVSELSEILARGASRIVPVSLGGL